MARALFALIAPNRLSEPLAQADHAQELTRNDPLRNSAPERQQKHLDDVRVTVVQRLRMLRARLAKSFFSMASAVAAGIATQHLSIGLPMPAPVLVVGSVFCFAWATLGRLGWASQSFRGDTSVERLDQSVFHILYWIGMYLGTIAAL